MAWKWNNLSVIFLIFNNFHCSLQFEMDSLRLLDEMEMYKTLTWKYIENSNRDLSSLKVSNILLELIDGNATDHDACPKRDGIYTIKLNGINDFSALCTSNIAGSGWMVVLKRSDGSINFFRDWKHYQKGFGDLSSEFFIGLDKLHRITYWQTHELFIYLEDFDNNTRYARYDEFLIGSEDNYYNLEKLGKFTGNAGDSLTYSATMRFYTYDKDNEFNCAVQRHSAGWFDHCIKNNIFGTYLNGYFDDSLDYKGVWWEYWRGDQYSLKTVLMMIRPKCSCS